MDFIFKGSRETTVFVAASAVGVDIRWSVGSLKPCGAEVPGMDCLGQNPLSTTPFTCDHDTYHSVDISLFTSTIKPMSVAAICNCEDWTRQFIQGVSCLGWPSFKAWTEVALSK